MFQREAFQKDSDNEISIFCAIGTEDCVTRKGTVESAARLRVREEDPVRAWQGQRNLRSTSLHLIDFSHKSSSQQGIYERCPPNHTNLVTPLPLQLMVLEWLLLDNRI